MLSLESEMIGIWLMKGKFLIGSLEIKHEFMIIEFLLKNVDSSLYRILNISDLASISLKSFSNSFKSNELSFNVQFL